MKYTIEDLRNGKCAVINDGTLEELKEVIQLAFPFAGIPLGSYNYYYNGYQDGYWACSSDEPDIPVQSVKDFLKPKSGYPKVMWVSDYSDFRDARKRVVFMEKCGWFIAWHSSDTIEKAEKEFFTTPWKYAKDIEEPQIVELTFKDISEGRGVGVDPSLIRIKE